MRLTLRTLLAYMDDLLDQRDSDDLQQKIQNSPLAGQLVHRIRNSIGQIRLDSPAIDGNGLGGDPNSVAEYLDNTLDPDRVPEFERVCLDSDEHLSEVASCHQILTLVLGEPARIPASTRGRIYALATQPDDSDLHDGGGEGISNPGDGIVGHSPTIAANPEPVAATVEPAQSRKEWESSKKSSYAHKQKTSRWPTLLATAAIAFVLVFAGLRGLGPFDQSHPIAKLMGVQQTKIAQADPVDFDVDAESLASIPSPPSSDNEFDDGVSREDPNAFSDDQLDPGLLTSDADNFANEIEPIPATGDELTHTLEPTIADATFESATPENFESDANASVDAMDGTELGDSPPDRPALAEKDSPTADFPGEPSDPIDGLADHLANGDADVPPTQSPAIAPPEPMPLLDPIAQRNATRTKGDAEVIPAFPTQVRNRANNDRANNDRASDEQIGFEAEDKVAPELLAGSGNNRANSGIDDVAATTNSDDAASRPNGVASDGDDVGRFVSQGQIVAYQTGDSGNWQRLSVDTPLAHGVEYVSLPVFRPQMTLANGLQLVLAGAARLTFEPNNDGVVDVRLSSGRMLAVPLEDTARSLRIQFGERAGQLNFADNESMAGIEFRRALEPGSNPEADTAHRVLQIFCRSGSFEWTEGDQTVEVAAGHRLVAFDDAPATALDSSGEPAWIMGSDAKHIHATARAGLSDKVETDRSMILALQEQAFSKRRREVRSLAARSLAEFGRYEPSLAALNDPDLKAYWSEHVETLQRVIAQDREAAANLRMAIEKQHKEDAAGLYRMLWGYSSKQLATQGSVLVDFLKHRSLDYRVVAIETLKGITGRGSVYAPEKNAEKTRKSIAYWQKMLENKEIQYKTPPEILEFLPST